MAEIVRMPKLSDTMTDGVIEKWHKKVGDKIKSGDLLADIATDKATMEFESFQDGVLLHIGVKEKQAVPVDSIIAILGKEGEDISSLLNQSTEVKSQKSEPAQAATNNTTSNASNTTLPAGVEVVRMPKLSDTMTDGVLEKWHKKVGDKVKSGELLADIATDKATMEFESFQDGVLIHIGVQEKQSVPVDSIIAILGKGGEDVNAILSTVNSNQGKVNSEKGIGGNEKGLVNSTNEIKPTNNNSLLTNNSDRIKASPLAKALAKEKGIDLTKVTGSGDNGRITKSDVENFKGSSLQTSGSKQQTVSFVNSGTEGFEDVTASQMRKTIARRLVESTTTVPVFYLNIEVDMDNAIASRNVINAIPDTKVSFNDMVIKACAAALRKHPQVNTSWMGDKVRYYSHIHIGMAVAVEDGLLVPVIRFADQKTFSQIAADAKELAKKAKDKKLQPAEMEGNTFTVSNLGMFGIESFTSIVNLPASCILSVGAIRQVPVVKNGAVVPGNTMMLSLACDHRTVDGATGAAFLQTLKTFIENPVTILV